LQVPLGVQLLARPFDERLLLHAAEALEAAVAFKAPPHVTAWHRR